MKENCESFRKELEQWHAQFRRDMDNWHRNRPLEITESKGNSEAKILSFYPIAATSFLPGRGAKIR